MSFCGILQAKGRCSGEDTRNASTNAPKPLWMPKIPQKQKSLFALGGQHRPLRRTETKILFIL